MGKTVLAALPSALLRAAASLGHDMDALRARAGIDASALADPDTRIPIAIHARLWEALAALDDDIGVMLGERLGTAALGVVGHALVHAETVGHALACVARYRRLVLDDAVPTLALETVHGLPRATFTQVLPAPFGALRHPAECQVTATLTLVRKLANENVMPIAVTLPHTAPNDLSRHHRVLGRAITWSGAHAVLVLDAAILSRPLVRTDDALFTYLARRADRLLEGVEPVTTTAALRQRLEVTLANGAPTMDEVASHLGLSVRTLHRRLEAEGTSLTRVLESVRRERAEMMLGDATIGIGHVAHALGYSEHAAFTRAFKRWTSMSPEAYKRAARRRAR
jgi:AraC-like DNA-binding protein